MIAFDQHTEAKTFIGEMMTLVTKNFPQVALDESIVASREEFIDALCAPAQIAVVSAHGEGFTPGKLFEPGVGFNSENWLRLSEFPGSRKIGVRAGIVWDVCNAGRPRFREELQPHLAHEITTIGVAGQVYSNKSIDDSGDIVASILQALLNTRSPLTTADTVANAFQIARGATRRNLTCARLGGG